MTAPLRVLGLSTPYINEMQDAAMKAEAGTEPVDLERVYREDGPRLQRAVLLFAGDRDVADDAVAEAFAQALVRGPELHDAKRWVWRVAFRIAAGALQQRRMELTRPHVAVEPVIETPDVPVALMAALAKLTPKQRGAVVLFHLGGYPTREVARILDSTAAAVTVHLSVGRKRLRDLLEDRDD
jgi:DNA-directed RNA polymerase specialized sigma24 family protein